MLGRRGRTRRKRRSCQSIKRAAVCSQDKTIIDLNIWMKENNFNNCTSLVPAYFTDTGRGLMTRRCITPGSKIVSIPGKLLITPAVVLSSDIGHRIKRWIPKLTFHQALSIFLLWERQKEQASMWANYIRVLPQQYTTCAFFTDNELSLLPLKLQRKFQEQIEKIYNAYSTIMKYCEKHWTEFYSLLTYKEFLWAWYSVNTRAVYFLSDLHVCEFLESDNNNIALAPYLDLLNHSCSAKTQAGYNKENNCYEITTEDKYKRYDQVFISYGSHDNYFLLLEYGFIVPRNTHDAYIFDFDDVLHAARQFDVQYLQQKDVIFSTNNLKSDLSCNTEGLSWKLQTALRVMAMDWNEMRKSLWKRAMLEDCKVSDRNESIVRNIAKYLIQSALDTSTQALKQFPNVPLAEMTVHQQLAYGIQNIERNILQKTMAML